MSTGKYVYFKFLIGDRVHSEFYNREGYISQIKYVESEKRSIINYLIVPIDDWTKSFWTSENDLTLKEGG